MLLQLHRLNLAAWLMACPALAAAGGVLPDDPFAAAPAAPQLHTIRSASEAEPTAEALPPPPPLQLRRVERSRPLTRVETESGEALSLRRADSLASLPIPEPEAPRLHTIAPRTAEAAPTPEPLSQPVLRTATPTPVDNARPAPSHGPRLRTIPPAEPSLTE
jgi:hypothetical protein